ncbi:MAG: ribosomal RNA small subunit methyltransferase I [Dehalococcoidia bacterium]|nr:MAG: ribosomal RNA small subunit methyltransferase I [Dehalococcoidia bacterium]
MALYLVATPIGNLEDITLRALRTLREVPLIAAEDTRSARVLLRHYGITTPVTSYHDVNKRSKLPALLAKLREGDLALISEAGTPGINDPGYELVVAAAAEGIAVVPVPGPSAPLAALTVSGLPADRFVYEGFLPRKSGERRRALRALASEPRTIVVLEAPHRLRESLTDVLAELGNRAIAVCRELTKLHEEVFRGDVVGALAHFTAPRGEFVLVLGGAPTAQEAAPIDALIAAGLAAGTPPARLAAEIASVSGARRRDVYRAMLARDGGTSDREKKIATDPTENPSQIR